MQTQQNQWIPAVGEQVRSLGKIFTVRSRSKTPTGKTFLFDQPKKQGTRYRLEDCEPIDSHPEFTIDPQGKNALRDTQEAQEGEAGAERDRVEGENVLGGKNGAISEDVKPIAPTQIFAASYFEPENHHGKLISISRSTPKGFQVDDRLPFLTPSADLLKRWKAGEVDEAEYTEIFQRQLEANEEKIRSWLESLQGDGSLTAVTLLCWERSGGNNQKGEFCHRNLVADFLERLPGCQVCRDTPKRATASDLALGLAPEDNPDRPLNESELSTLVDMAAATVGRVADRVEGWIEGAEKVGGDRPMSNQYANRQSPTASTSIVIPSTAASTSGDPTNPIPKKGDRVLVLAKPYLEWDSAHKYPDEDCRWMRHVFVVQQVKATVATVKSGEIRKQVPIACLQVLSESEVESLSRPAAIENSGPLESTDEIQVEPLPPIAITELLGLSGQLQASVEAVEITPADESLLKLCHWLLSDPPLPEPPFELHPAIWVKDGYLDALQREAQQAIDWSQGKARKHPRHTCGALERDLRALKAISVARRSC